MNITTLYMYMYIMCVFMLTKHLPSPPATYLTPIHHSTTMVEWWYTWRKEIWLFFLRRMKKN